MAKRMGKKAGSAVKALDAATFVGELLEVKGTLESLLGYLREAEQQRTERSRIDAEAKAHVERVRAFREVVGLYLERSFDERLQNFEGLFVRLDKAAERGDLQMASATLGAMVALAKHSPLEALADAARFQKTIEDKSTDWRF